jgi:sterol desaturase/sphingolipid hydroxylase (fatty acid hydroxylase superfamily)
MARHAATHAMNLTAPQVIVLAMPVFLLLIALEWAWGVRRGRNTYRLSDALSSISLGLMSQLTGLLVTLFSIGIYTWVWQHAALWQLSPQSLWVWAVALLLYDFLYYWHHRLGHEVAVLWAAHVVHHQSEDYNLSTALRQTSSGFVLGWVFHLPMALLGFPPVVFATVALVDLLYQFWVHTQQVGRLGGFDRWFCSPSNHRAHHAVNEVYLDRNYGGILMVWDRLFGTFQPELDSEPCVYGTRSPLRSWNPLWANVHTYAELWRESRLASRWTDRLQVWLRHPGWRPPEVARAHPKAAFEPAALRRYDPPLAAARAAGAVAVFALCLGVSAVLMWQAKAWPAWGVAAGVALLLGLLWAANRLLTPQQALPEPGSGV